MDEQITIDPGSYVRMSEKFKQELSKHSTIHLEKFGDEIGVVVERINDLEGMKFVVRWLIEGIHAPSFIYPNEKLEKVEIYTAICEVGKV